MMTCGFGFRRPAALVLPLLILLFFAGCAGESVGEDGDLFRQIGSRDASFTAVFPSTTNLAEDVRCAGVKSPDGVTLTVTSPGRSAGMVLTLRRSADPGGFSTVLSFPHADMPAAVDPSAAKALCAVFSLLYDCGEETASSVYLPAFRRLSPDDGSEETAFVSAAGSLILSSEGVPVRAECPDLGGNTRTVLFEDYRFDGP